MKTYIVLYNYGVESADFTPLMELFDDNSVLEFEDPKIGVFEGKELIGGMFGRQAPTEKIEITNFNNVGNKATADYYIEGNTDSRAGGFKLTISGNKIERLIVTL